MGKSCWGQGGGLLAKHMIRKGRANGLEEAIGFLFVLNTSLSRLCVDVCVFVCVCVCVCVSVCDVLHISTVFASLAACLDFTIDGLLRAPPAPAPRHRETTDAQLNVKPSVALQTK